MKDTLSRVLSIIALVVSIAALGVGIMGYLETRQQNRLAMSPKLQLERNFDRPTKRGGLYLINSGVGPATVESFSFMGVELKGAVDKLALSTVIEKKINPTTFPNSHSRIKIGTFTKDDMIPPGGRYAILEISDVDFSKDGEEKEWSAFQALLDDMRIQVRYRSNHGAKDATQWPN